MQGNIQIEVLNKNAVMVSSNLKDISWYDKQILVMALAHNLDLTETDLLLIPALYSDFIAESKRAKTDLSNNRSTTDL